MKEIGLCKARFRESSVTRFYFDISDGDANIPDEEGLQMPDAKAAEIEAANSLADVIRDAALTGRLAPLSIEVFDEDREPVFRVSVEFKKANTNRN